MDWQLERGSREVAFIPQPAIILNHASHHIEQWFTLQLGHHTIHHTAGHIFVKASAENPPSHAPPAPRCFLSLHYAQTFDSTDAGVACAAGEILLR